METAVSNLRKLSDAFDIKSQLKPGVCRFNFSYLCACTKISNANFGFHICCENTEYHSATDLLRIHQKSNILKYVDGITAMVKTFNMLKIRSAIMAVSNDSLISVENVNFLQNCA